MLPVIDLAGDCVEALRAACHASGFCYITGHDVPTDLDAKVMRDAREFFALPAADKQALAIANTPRFRGYTVLGAETTRGASDWREQLDLGPEEAIEALSPGEPAWRRLRGPNQWPAGLPQLRESVLAWMQAMDRVGLKVLRALATGLGQPADRFDDVVLPRGDPHMKIMRYPAQDAGQSSDQGVGWHHDSGLISFILQDEVGGLQVDVDGTKVEAAPKHGMYVMNLGEMLQAATSGYLRATPHRVQSPPVGCERISVAYFFHPRLDAVFAPIDLPPELAQQARGGQNVDPNDPVFSVFGENYLKIRLRSHVDVAQAHYADLTE